MISCVFRNVSGASQGGNLRLYHLASPLRRRKFAFGKFCLYVPQHLRKAHIFHTSRGGDLREPLTRLWSGCG